jgi:energy-coupling factor transporter ATP-binding protein EcfA2
MRLRYLHLPRCGPLTDTAIVFGREDLIAKTLNLPRKGSLNLVVGVNGSGKSSLLRAIYRIFRALKNNEFPAMPVTMAWDIAPAEKAVTAFFHMPDHKNEKPYFIALDLIPSVTDKVGWLQLTNVLKSDIDSDRFKQPIERGDAVLGSYLQAHLPKRLIAYTSGTDDPWEQIDRPIFHPRDEEEGQYQTEDERPQGWSMDREWEEEQPVRISNSLTHHFWKSGGMATEAVERLRQELGALEAIRKKVLSNRMPRGDLLDDFYFRISHRDLRIAGITLALWQSAKELFGRSEEVQQEALRNIFLRQRNSDSKAQGARRVLNQIDWFWPTHLSLVYHDTEDRLSPRQRQELLCLVALADEVLAQPLGRHRAVFSLGPSDRISLTEKLKDAFPLGIPNKGIEPIADRIDGCKTGSEAILRVFSSDKDIDSTPAEVFSRLREWERTGLLDNITLTVKRLDCPESPTYESDDTIVTYDQLSDGEQMLLGRMGLLFLLRGQDGSLLLLDEPETHFNDVWKREIVEMMDMALLSSTEANIIVATHTSIVLTDAFAAEVTVLDKKEGAVTARGVKGGLFGTDPGEVAMNLFRAEGSTGRRSIELLDQLLKTEWEGREKDLEAILNILGSSFHRAELRAVLKGLQAKNDGSASS